MAKRSCVTLLVILALGLAPAAAHAQKLADAQSRRAALESFKNGQEFMSAEQFEKAADEYTKAVASDPLFTVAYYQLGQAYMNLRRYASAIEALKNCIESAKKLYSLAETDRFEVERRRDDDINRMREYVQQLQRTGHTAQAAAADAGLHDLENQRTSASAEFRPPAEALLSLGSAYFRSGDRAQAEAEWQAAIQVNPKFGQAYNNLAVAYMQDGRKQDALAAVKSAEKSGFRVNPQLKKDINAMP